MSCDFVALASEGIQGLVPYQGGKPVDELKRELGLIDVVKLASNENPLGASPKAIAAAKAVLDNAEAGRYPDGNGFYLKKALSEKYDISTDCITLGNGSNDILEFIGRAYLSELANENGDKKEAIFSKHSFAVYPLVVQSLNAKAVVTAVNDWQTDLNAILAAVSENTRVIFIANPNNPTGTWVQRQAWEAFLANVPEHIIIVLDEAYTEYVSEAEYPNGLDYLSAYPNLVVTRTFSKAYGLASLRMGYSFSHPQVADVLNRVRQPFNVNSCALAGAEAALADTEFLAEVVQTNAEGMVQIEVGVTALGLSFIKSVGNFICFECEAGQAGMISDLLLKQGVIIRPVANYEMPNHLRVSIGTYVENERFLQALKSSLQKAAA